MKQGRSLTELAKEVENRANAKKDFVADTRNMHVVPGSGDFGDWKSIDLELKDIGHFPITDHAHGQISGFTDIPKKYYDRMREEDPNLLALNVNHWMKEKPKRRLVRTLERPPIERHLGLSDPDTLQSVTSIPVAGENPIVPIADARAFLSDRYRIMDNEEVLEAILPIISDMGSVRIESCDVTDTRLWLKIVFPWLETEVEHEGRKVGDIVQAGITLGNSEIGCGKTFVDPMIYRLSCLNGARMRDHGMSKFHVGKIMGEGKDAVQFFKDDTLMADDKAFLLKLRDVVRASADEVSFKLLVDKFSETTRNKIEGDPVKSIEVVQRKFGFNDEEKYSVLKHLISGGDLNQYGVSNAITAASQDSNDYDRASDMERFGGQVIELKKTEWAEIAKAA
jgi:hypothetical protein